MRESGGVPVQNLNWAAPSGGSWQVGGRGLWGHLLHAARATQPSGPSPFVGSPRPMMCPNGLHAICLVEVGWCGEKQQPPLWHCSDLAFVGCNNTHLLTDVLPCRNSRAEKFLQSHVKQEVFLLFFRFPPSQL